MGRRGKNGMRATIDLGRSTVQIALDVETSAEEKARVMKKKM